MDAAAEILPTIPKEQRNRVATFLEGRGMFDVWVFVLWLNLVYFRS